MFLREQRLRSLRWHCPACYRLSKRLSRGGCRHCGSSALSILLSKEYIRIAQPLIRALRKLHATVLGESLPAAWVRRKRKGPLRRYSRGRFTEVDLL